MTFGGTRDVDRSTMADIDAAATGIAAPAPRAGGSEPPLGDAPRRALGLIGRPDRPLERRPGAPRITMPGVDPRGALRAAATALRARAAASPARAGRGRAIWRRHPSGPRLGAAMREVGRGIRQHLSRIASDPRARHRAPARLLASVAASQTTTGPGDPPSEGATAAPSGPAPATTPASATPEAQLPLDEVKILVSEIVFKGASPELVRVAKQALVMKPNFAYTIQEVDADVGRVQVSVPPRPPSLAHHTLPAISQPPSHAHFHPHAHTRIHTQTHTLPSLPHLPSPPSLFPPSSLPSRTRGTLRRWACSGPRIRGTACV